MSAQSRQPQQTTAPAPPQTENREAADPGNAAQQALVAPPTDPGALEASRAALQGRIAAATRARDLTGLQAITTALAAATAEARRGPAGPAVPRTVVLGTTTYPVDDVALAALTSEAAAGQQAAVGPPAAAGARTSAFGEVPERYAHLDGELLALLGRSRQSLFRSNPTADFWTQLDTLSPDQLRTLVVTTDGARDNGLWRTIGGLRGIYSNGSSWGIEFYAISDLTSFARGGPWCRDLLQDSVRRQHGNTRHEWWRHGSGAGNAGMHLGIDDGQGYSNLHWDGTNPSAGRLPGTESCTYSVPALVGHEIDIGLVPFLPANRDDPNQVQPAPFHQLEVLWNVAGRAGTLVDRYEVPHPSATNSGVYTDRIHGAIAQVRAVRDRARPLAVDPDLTDGQRATLDGERQVVQGTMFEALALFYEWLAQTAFPSEARTLSAYATTAAWERGASIEGAIQAYFQAHEVSNGRRAPDSAGPHDAGV